MVPRTIGRGSLSPEAGRYRLSRLTLSVMLQFTLARFLWGPPPVISDVSVYSGRVLWGPPPKISGTTLGQHWMGKIHFPSKNHNGTTVGQHYGSIGIHFPSKNHFYRQRIIGTPWTINRGVVFIGG